MRGRSSAGNCRNRQPDRKEEMTAKAKRAPSTRKILEACIEDIEIGRWCKHHLGVMTKTNGLKKPMGCALGLVGIESGALEVVDVGDGYVHIVDDEHYPSRGDWPKSAVKAVKLLAETVRFPKKEIEKRLQEGREKAQDNETDETLGAIETVVYYFNDQGISSKQGALNWFKRALAKLDEK